MKVFIQEINSHEFMGNDGNWVGSADLARDFKTGLHALDFCLAHHLSGVQIRAIFRCATQEITWAVRPFDIGRRD